MLHDQVVGEAGHAGAVAQQAGRHLQAGGRLGRDGLRLSPRPVRRVGGQGGHHLLGPVVGEQAVDFVAHGADGGGAGIGGEGRQDLLGLLGVGRQHLLQGRQVGGGDEVGRQAHRQAVRRLQPSAGQGQVEPRTTRQAGQEPPGADVGEQADAGLGHGEGRAFGGHLIARGPADADPAAHGHPVHHRDHRLGIAEDQVVQLVLDEEEPPRRHAVAHGAVGQGADVAAGAEAPLAGVVDQHRVQGRIVQPGQQGRDHPLADAGGQGAEGLRPVDRQPAQRAVTADQDFGFDGGLAHPLSISRAMITRMISLVPSRIW